MTARLTYEWFYEFTPYQGFQLRTDPEYVEAKGRFLGHRDLRILHHGPIDDPQYTFRSVTRKTVEVIIPGWAPAWLRPTNTVTQIESWQPERSDGTRIFDLVVKIRGVPVGIRGRGILVPTGIIGCRYDISATVRSRVPGVGRRLEDFVAGQLRHTMEGEGEFAGRWLARR